MSWVPLHVHSQYSILDSSASVDAIAEKAAEFKMPAVALTDQGNMYGAVEFFKACKGAGVKPIIGCELYVAPHSRHEKKRIPGTAAWFSDRAAREEQTGLSKPVRLEFACASRGILLHAADR